MPKVTEQSKKVSHSFGEALTSQREATGFAKQGDAADASAALAREAADVFESFSQQWLSRLESDRTGERIDAANRRKLRTLSYLLGWSGFEFEQHVGVPVGTVPRLEDSVESSGMVKRGSDEEARVRIPSFHGLAEGIVGFEDRITPNTYRHVALSELPEGVKRSRLLFTRIRAADLYDETLAFSIPVGSQLLIEAKTPPEDKQLVVAYLPERNLGVLTQFRKEAEEVLFRSYRVGGDVFWSSDCPELRIGGVVRQVCFEP